MAVIVSVNPSSIPAAVHGAHSTWAQGGVERDT
jgi:hypothetical protein